MPRLITKISCTWSVMETVQAFLKVSKLANKGQFERYSIRYLPKFISVNELKQYLLENYSEELSPASNCTSLTISYMSDRHRKCDIKTEKQLDDAYRTVKRQKVRNKLLINKLKKDISICCSSMNTNFKQAFSAYNWDGCNSWMPICMLPFHFGTITSETVAKSPCKSTILKKNKTYL